MTYNDKFGSKGEHNMSSGDDIRRRSTQCECRPAKTYVAKGLIFHANAYCVFHCFRNISKFVPSISQT